MSIAQKVIKYLAMAFAIALIVGIITTIVRVVSSMPLTLKIGKNVSDNTIETSTDFEDEDIASLDIDIAFSNLTIKKGEKLKVETTNKDIQCKQDKQKIKIKEKDYNWFFNNTKKEELIVYVPENLQFDKININTGAGKVNIEILNAGVLKMSLGAGETSIKNINVTESAKIDTGAGKVSISSAKITELKCDLGIGATEISAKLSGNTKISTGVGSLKLNVLGIKEEYKTRVNKGIGNVTIDEKTIVDNEVVGNGENKIDIDGGIGEIKINFKGE